MRRKVYAMAAPVEVPPVAVLNMTPLIDVLLVLLIMFILTVPAATHKVAIDLPVPVAGPGLPPIAHRLTIDRAGAVTLDGAHVPDAALPARLRAIAAEPRALLRFAPDAKLRYGRVDALLAEVKRAGITRLAFGG